MKIIKCSHSDKKYKMHSNNFVDAICTECGKVTETYVKPTLYSEVIQFKYND